MRAGDPTNPFRGRPGFWNRWNEFFYRFTGGAQVGIGRGRVEAPYAPPADPRCPVCSERMAAHVIERGTPTTPTRLHCPTVAAR